MVQLFSMVLDFLDALAGAVAIACWWCTWVRPAKPPTPPSEPAELDRFVHAAQTGVGAESPNKPPPQVTTCRSEPAASDQACSAQELSAKRPLTH